MDNTPRKPRKSGPKPGKSAPSKRRKAAAKPAKDPRIPAPPGPLSPLALMKWEALALDLIDRGNWSDRDRHALYVLADSLAAYETASVIIARDGQVVDGEYGLVRNPAATVQNQAWDRIQKLLHSFGLTPSGRAALKQPDQKPPSLAEVLGL